MSEERLCQNCRGKFVIEDEDFLFYARIEVPPPTFCVECRQQRRLAFRNEQALYKRKCDLCGKSVVSRSSPIGPLRATLSGSNGSPDPPASARRAGKPYPLYCQTCWWSDEWDPTSYGRDYDFSKPFFEQFKELFFSVPHISLLSTNTVNSEWVNNETDDKNCYLNVGGHFNEDSAYNTYEIHGRDCFDNYWVGQSELCSGCVNCERCYRALFSDECYDCRDTVLSYDCRNCVNILGCAGLRNKQYCIWNVQHSKESYLEFLKQHPLSSHRCLEELKKKAADVWRSVPHRDLFMVRTYHSTGNYLTDAKNARNCWTAETIENCKNIYLALGLKDSYDSSSIGWGELNYEGAHCGGLYASKFFAFVFGGAGGASVTTINSSFLEYCHTTPACSSCFGCANLRKQEYCILNKKYSKEEYEALAPKIRKHMMDMPYTDVRGRVYRYGEFFPIEFSPFGYNETAAQDYYPLGEAEAKSKGYPWSDYVADTHYEFSDYEIPNDIKDVKDDILEKILKCEATGKAYRIIPMELQFYRRLGIPLPRRAPLTRHRERFARLLPRKLFARMCECRGSDAARNGFRNTVLHPHGSNACGASIETPYAPPDPLRRSSSETSRPEVVYCESCYKAEVS